MEISVPLKGSFVLNLKELAESLGVTFPSP